MEQELSMDIIDEESQNLDWNMDPLDLFSFNVVTFDNNEPDIQVDTIKHDTELALLIQERFGDDPIQTIVNNRDPETKGRCPYFRIVTNEFGPDSAINFKLRAFYNRIGMSSLNSRCGPAMAIGLHALNLLDSPVSVPMAFCTTSIEFISFQMDGGVDLTCLKPCAKNLNPEATNLCGIAGVCLPYYMPEEVQWRILSFAESPTAMEIKGEIKRLRERWDDCLHPMFKQREPRIPAHIARFYDVATVQSAIADATRRSRVSSVLQGD